jgi:hypothetical protein
MVQIYRFKYSNNKIFLPDKRANTIPFDFETNRGCIPLDVSPKWSVLRRQFRKNKCFVGSLPEEKYQELIKIIEQQKLEM